MSRVLREPTTLVEIKGDRPMRLLCSALRDRYRMDFYGIAVRYDDTVATYQVNTQERIGKAKLEQIKVYTDGVVEGMRLAGLI